MPKKRAKTSKKSAAAARVEAQEEARFFGDEQTEPQHFLSMQPCIQELLLQFEDQNDNLPVEIEGFHVQIHTHGRRLEMCVTIPEDASAAKIDRAWKTIMKWRKRLTAFQGKRNELMEFLSIQHLQLSYLEIANQLNADLERHLLGDSYARVRYVLGEFGFSPNAIDECIKTASARLLKGESAFAFGLQPITRDHVRDRLDTWRQRPRRTRRK